LHEWVHPEFVFYNKVDIPRPGVQGLIDAEQKNFDAFESFRCPIETLVAEGDKVAANSPRLRSPPSRQNRPPASSQTVAAWISSVTAKARQ
jgi:SnoaL-like polyketide cyclase